VPRPSSRPGAALALMLVATLAFAGMQTTVKLARDAGIGTLEVMFVRNAPAIPVLLFLLRRRGAGVWPEAPREVLVRSLFGVVAMATNFAAMGELGVAEFATLILLQPVFMALAAPMLLGERVSARTWGALGVALGGAVVAVAPVGPGLALPPVASALAVGSALAAALAQIWIRRATASEPAERVVVHFYALVSLVSASAALAAGQDWGPTPTVTVGRYAALTAGMAGLGTLGQVLMTRAYSLGQATPVAIVGYSGIGFGLGCDLLFFGRLPTPRGLAGALVLGLAGLLLVRAGRRVPVRGSPDLGQDG